MWILNRFLGFSVVTVARSCADCRLDSPKGPAAILVHFLLPCSCCFSMLSCYVVKFRHVQNSGKGPTWTEPNARGQSNSGCCLWWWSGRPVGILCRCFYFSHWFCLSHYLGWPGLCKVESWLGLMWRRRVGGAWDAGYWQLAEAAVSWGRNSFVGCFIFSPACMIQI